MQGLHQINRSLLLLFIFFFSFFVLYRLKLELITLIINDVKMNLEFFFFWVYTLFEMSKIHDI